MNALGVPKRSALRQEIAGAATLRLVTNSPLLNRVQPTNCTRRCIACGVLITNDTLGGHQRSGAFADPVWCLDCAN